MNGFNLLVQVVLPLALLHLALHTATNTLLNLQNIQLGFNLGQQLFKPITHRKNLKDSLFLLELHGQVGCDGVGKPAGLFHTHEAIENLGGDLLIKFDELIKLPEDRAAQGLDLGPLMVIKWKGATDRLEVVLLLNQLNELSPLNTLDQDLHGPVGQLEHLKNAGEAANGINIARARLVLRG